MADEEILPEDSLPDVPEAEAVLALAAPMSAGRDVQTRSIEDEMRQSYLDYAMSTIIARALPDARDGLKPVQRRILMGMSDLNLTPGSQHRKVGQSGRRSASGNYHPHGDAAIYATMVRMAQRLQSALPARGRAGQLRLD